MKRDATSVKNTLGISEKGFEGGVNNGNKIAMRLYRCYQQC